MCVEFVLNAIVERKEVKDLSGSIIDRRYVLCCKRVGSSTLSEHI